MSEQLREKLPILMRDMPCSKYKCDFWDVQGHYCFLSIDDKDVDCPMTREVLALIPDIAREKWKSHTATLKECDRFYGERIEEAKKQERERIIKELEELHRPDYRMKDVVIYLKYRFGIKQALKETEGEK